MFWRFTIILLLFLNSAACSQPGPDTLWTRMLVGHGMLYVDHLFETENHEFMIVGAGNLDSNGSNWGLLAARFDSEGAVQWARSYRNGMRGSCVAEDMDGSLLFGVWLSSHTGIVKTRADGDTIWTRDPGQSDVLSIARTSDYGFVIATSNAFLKINDSADLLWRRERPANGQNDLTDVQSVSSGETIALYSKTHQCYVGQPPYLANCEDTTEIIKFGTNGDTIWTSTQTGRMDRGGCLIRSSNSGSFFWLARWIESGPSNDVYVALHKADSSGNPLWTTQIFDLYPTNLLVTIDGGLVVAGYGNGAESILEKFNADGTQQWRHVYSFLNNVSGVVQTNEGSFILTGKGSSISEIVVVKTERDPALSTNFDPSRLGKDLSLSQNYPNPFNPQTEIEFELPREADVSLKVFNISGQEVAELIHGKLASGSHHAVFDGSSLPSGIYFYSLSADKNTQTRKMILLK
jgi:hypothetical protein